jgi:hypothetical protein
MYRSRSSRKRSWLAILAVAVGLTVVWALSRGDGDAPGRTTGADAVEEPDEHTNLLPPASALVAGREDSGKSRGTSSADAAPAPPAAGPPRDPSPPGGSGSEEAKEAEGGVPSEPKAPPPSRRAQNLIERGLALSASDRPIEARALLSAALRTGGLSASDTTAVRATLAGLNERLVFGPLIAEQDPFSFAYTVQPNDSLAGIARRLSLQVDWRFIQRINGIPDDRMLRAGDRIKVVTGPFHVRVDKSDYRMDLYMGEDDAQVYVRSFDVGLGEFNSTPIGLFRVRPGSKLINPEWVNPRTRQRYLPEDPENPIGERWIGIEGMEEATRELSGLGIHGTIEPESVGRQVSMGCIRMRHEDVVLLYALLVEEISAVKIEE